MAGTVKPTIFHLMTNVELNKADLNELFGYYDKRDRVEIIVEVINDVGEEKIPHNHYVLSIERTRTASGNLYPQLERIYKKFLGEYGCTICCTGKQRCVHTGRVKIVWPEIFTCRHCSFNYYFKVIKTAGHLRNLVAYLEKKIEEEIKGAIPKDVPLQTPKVNTHEYDSSIWETSSTNTSNVNRPFAGLGVSGLGPTGCTVRGRIRGGELLEETSKEAKRQRVESPFGWDTNSEDSY